MSFLGGRRRSKALRGLAVNTAVLSLAIFVPDAVRDPITRPRRLVRAAIIPFVTGIAVVIQNLFMPAEAVVLVAQTGSCAQNTFYRPRIRFGMRCQQLSCPLC